MSHKGTMESLKGHAKAFGEKKYRALPSEHGEAEAHGKLQKHHSPVSHSEHADRYSSRHAGEEVQHFTGKMHKGAISMARHYPVLDEGPRKRGSAHLNRSGDNGQHGRFVRSGITKRAPDVID